MPNIDPDLLAASLRRLDSQAGGDVAHALEQTAHACVALFGVTGSGVMIADEHNNLHYVAASDAPGSSASEKRYGMRFCRKKSTSGRPI